VEETRSKIYKNLISPDKKEPYQKMINLHTYNKCLSPSLTLASVAQTCEEVGFDSIDSYGDFKVSCDVSSLRNFEGIVAKKFGVKDSLFVVSGVMAQNIALKQYAVEKKKQRFLCHKTSHLLLHEHNAFDHLLNLEAVVIDTDEAMSFEDVSKALEGPGADEIGTVIIEVPQREIGSRVTSWDDLEKMSDLCKSKNIAFHLDGARIWEISPHFEDEGKSYADLVALFDSTYVSFYKGLGGITGAMLFGTETFIAASRIWLRRFGGNVFSLYPLVASCWEGFNKNVACNPTISFFQKRARMREIVELLSGDDQVNKVVTFDPPRPTCCITHVYIKCESNGDLEAANEFVKKTEQITVFNNLRPRKPGNSAQSYWEWNLGNENYHIRDEIILRGFRSLVSNLAKRQK